MIRVFTTSLPYKRTYYGILHKAKKPKVQLSAENVMNTVFCDYEGDIYIEFMG